MVLPAQHADVIRGLAAAGSVSARGGDGPGGGRGHTSFGDTNVAVHLPAAQIHPKEIVSAFTTAFRNGHPAFKR
jgi:hypothetical protein